VKRRPDVGIPVLTERFPRLLVQRRHRRRSAGVEHERRWTRLPKRGFGEPRIGCIADNDRDTESSLELGEARGIARDDGDVGVTRNERFDHPETEPAATTGDENTLLFECLHDCSVLLLFHRLRDIHVAFDLGLRHHPLGDGRELILIRALDYREAFSPSPFSFRLDFPSPVVIELRKLPFI